MTFAERVHRKEIAGIERMIEMSPADGRMNAVVVARREVDDRELSACVALGVGLVADELGYPVRAVL